MNIRYVYTDTIAGEPNYTWVKTGSFKITDKTSNLSICRKVKKAVGLEAVRGVTVKQGDYIAFYPRRSATILTWQRI